MSIESAKIISETGEKLGIDKPTIQIASMLAFMGATDSVVPVLGAGLNKKLTLESETANPKPKKAEGYTKIEKIIVDMLTENTGSHFLDSGGAYGRNWEKNRHVEDFRDKPPFEVQVNKFTTSRGETIKEVLFDIDLFQYLTTYLDTDKNTGAWNKRLGQILKDHGQLESMEILAQELKDQGKIESWSTFNSYNGESNLSQVIQGTWLFTDDCYEGYLILQIHNGCDVRGGYTDPKVFKVQSDGGPADMMCGDSGLDASCKCGSIYSDDHGHHWYNGDIHDLEQTDFKGNHVKALTVKGDKLPTEWEYQEKGPDAPKQYTDKYVLRCKRCGEIPTFTARFEV